MAPITPISNLIGSKLTLIKKELHKLLIEWLMFNYLVN